MNYQGQEEVWSSYYDVRELHEEASRRNVQYFENLKIRIGGRYGEFLDNFVNSQVKLEATSDDKIDIVDDVETTALHRVVGLHGCVSSEDEENALKCAEILLRNLKANVNLYDENNNTPLHLAVANRMEKMTVLLISEKAATWVKSNNKMQDRYCLATDIAIEFPDLMKDCFDAAVSESPDKKYIRLSWSPIIPYPIGEINRTDMGENNVPADLDIEMAFLHSVIDGDKQVERKLLMHPLVEAFLHLRKKKYWLRFGSWYYTLKMIYLAVYIAFVSKLYLTDCPYKTETGDDGKIKILRCVLTSEVKVLAYGIAATFTFLQLPIELRTMKADSRYLRTWQNWIFILSSFAVGVTIWPPLTLKQSYNIRWQYPYAAVGMCLSLWLILIQLGTIPQVARFINMLFQVIKTVVIVCVVFLPMLLGYYFGLQLMFASSFGTFDFLQMVVIGGDYEKMVNDIRNSDESTVHIFTAYLFCSTFIVLITIVFLNFLLGMAVNDIQRLYRFAMLSHRSSEIRQYYHVDKFGGEFFNSFAVVLIKGWTMRMQKKNYDKIWVIDVDHNGNAKSASVTGEDVRFPMKIMKDLLDIVRSKPASTTTALSNNNNQDVARKTLSGRSSAVFKDFQSSSERFRPMKKTFDSFSSVENPYHQDMTSQDLTDIRSSVKLLLQKIDQVEKKVSTIEKSVKELSNN